MKALAPTLAGLSALAACSVPEHEPPSLAPRPIEAMTDAPPRAVPPIESRADAALAERIARLVADAERGDGRFRAELPNAQAALGRARGAAVQSEAWIAAQLALSALDATRGPASTALGELDAILSEQVQSRQSVEVERLEAARVRVEEINARQAAEYAALAGSISSR